MGIIIINIYPIFNTVSKNGEFKIVFDHFNLILSYRKMRIKYSLTLLLLLGLATNEDLT